MLQALHELWSVYLDIHVVIDLCLVMKICKKDTSMKIPTKKGQTL